MKNEVLKLDDFVGGEDADVQAGLTDPRMKAMKEALEKAQAIRLLSQRLIDFLAQELNSEANTLCSKSASLELTNAGLSLKGVIDQFKEQAANVE